jgi:hypothetical protein
MQERRVNSCKQNVSTLANTETYTETESETKKYPQTPTGDLFPVQGVHEEPKAEKTWEPTLVMLEIGSWFGRKPTTRWSAKELKSLKAISTDMGHPPELHIVRAWHTAKITGESYRRKSVATLLNNWNDEIDKARRFIDERRKIEPTFAMEVKL